MNPELEATADEREEMEAAYRELCAEECDALYALEAAHSADTFPEMNESDIPW